MRNYPLGSDPVQIYYDIYSKRARQKCVEFALDLDAFGDLTGRNCQICNEQPLTVILVANVRYYFQSIDRYDRSQDYTKENTFPCCSVCIQARGQLDYDSLAAKRKAQLTAYLHSR